MEMNEAYGKVIISDRSRDFRSRCADELRRCGIEVIAEASDSTEAYKKTADLKPQVLLCELSVTSDDCVSLIEKCRGTLGKNSPEIIVMSSFNNEEAFRECCDAGAAYCVIKPLDYKFLASRITRLIRNRKRNLADVSESFELESRVTSMLHNMGVPANLKGYYYLRSAIIRSVNDRSNLEMITKKLYPEIAKEYSSTSSRIERSMRHAIEVAWQRGDPDILYKYFGYTVSAYKSKPSNSEFIAMLADNIYLKKKELAIR